MSEISSASERNETASGEESILKILVTTDNHLGYAEKDAVRGEDSFRAFEECLEQALENDVDFILLGGDLFHDTNPSSHSLHKCMRLLRRYTQGDKSIEFEIINSQEQSFLDTLNRTANFEDPNMNVSIPVFSIHGNHDDPSGFGRLSSLDILSCSGLVNYFGKWTNLDHVNINPIMIKKGDTKLALFGLSHIYDTRLVRLFADYKVTLEKPDDSWFNLLVLHQNRADRGPKNYLPEEILPSFMDLIIWGHEHDCRIIPEQNELKNFFVSQPGSTTLPIIRLRVQFENEEQIFNPIRFGQNYVGRVANPTDMILRQKQPKKREEIKPLDKEAMQGILEDEKANKQVRVEDIVGQYFDTVGTAQKLKVLTNMCMTEVMRRLVDSEDYYSADYLVDFHVDRANAFLIEKQPEEAETANCLEDFQCLARKTLKDAIEGLDGSGVDEQTMAARQKFLQESANGSKMNATNDDGDDDVELVSPPLKGAKANTTATRGRGRGAGRARGAARGAASAATGRATTAATGRKKPLDVSATNTSLRAPSARTQTSKPKKSLYDSSDSE